MDNPYSSPTSQPGEGGVAPEKPPIAGLGGWLVVVGIALFVQTIARAIYLVSTLGTLDAKVWNALTSPQGAAYDPLWKPAIVCDLAVSGLLLVADILLIVLYFRKSRWFPRAFILVQSISLIYVIASLVVAKAIHNFPEKEAAAASTQVLRQAVYCVIWFPYMLRSVRVANTFTR